MDERPKRVLVCGTTFGQVYLEALRGDPRFQLAGIMAQGSLRSRACAAHYDTPLYDEPSRLPADIDMACVVVRGDSLGGRGSELARALMARGIHVLQEQPLHPDEVAESLRRARDHGVRFTLNSFYRHLPSVRRFVAAARALLRQRAPLHVRAVTAVQAAYPLLDILHAVLGRIRPFQLALAERVGGELGPDAYPSPFRRLEGAFAGVSLSLEIQNQLDPADPDSHVLTLHRISIGTDAGDLTLMTTHGPIIWCARPEIPREMREATSTTLFAETAIPGDDIGTAALGAAEQPSQRALFRAHWPQAVRHALQEFSEAGRAGESLRSAQNQLALCRAWQEASTLLGPPALLRKPAGPALSMTELTALSRAASAAEGQP